MIGFAPARKIETSKTGTPAVRRMLADEIDARLEAHFQATEAAINAHPDKNVRKHTSRAAFADEMTSRVAAALEGIKLLCVTLDFTGETQEAERIASGVQNILRADILVL